MLEKIKAIYFSLNEFTYLEERRKLKLIRYNKIYQTTLGISLINYKTLSGKCIIHEGKDIWKIYDTFEDHLIFEGNYPNGEGKEYEEGKLIFEGEYLNGKRNGNGKQYDEDGNLIFEGVYKNVLKNGRYVEYSVDGKKIIEGEFLNGNFWNTKEYDKNGNIISEKKMEKELHLITICLIMEYM